MSTLQHLPQELAAFRAEVNARFERIDTRFERIDKQFERIDTQFERIDTQFERVYSQMRMLHEDLVARIATLNEGRDHGGTAARRPRSSRPKR